MVRPACSDPPEIASRLWDGFCGSLAFDVGANCGQSLPSLAERFTHVVAFEPAAESWEILSERFGRADWATLVNAAVSSQNGEAVLWETPGNLEQGQLVSSEHYAFRVAQAGPRTVPCMTLVRAARSFGVPDFVKVDTEGHEIRVLRGAGELRPDWLIEFHSEAGSLWCQGEFRDNGYRIEVVRHPHYDEGSFLWLNHGWLKAFAR